MELHDRDVSLDPNGIELPEESRCGREELPPPDTYDPVIEVYKRDVDRTLLIENLRLTPAQRAEKFEDFMNFLDEIQRSGRKLRDKKS